MAQQNEMLTFNMTRAKAKELGLLICKTCGLPENNHFSWGKKPSAHNENCKEFLESGIKGIEMV